MAATKDVIKVRVDRDIKERVAELYGHWGLNLSDAVNMFFRQSLDCGGLPFLMNLTQNGPRILPDYPVMRPSILDNAALVPADWDDPEDAVYDRFA